MKIGQKTNKHTNKTKQKNTALLFALSFSHAQQMLVE